MNRYPLISHDLGIDLIEAAKKKLEEINKKISDREGNKGISQKITLDSYKVYTFADVI